MSADQLPALRYAPRGRPAMSRRRKKWNGVRFVAIDHPVLDSYAFAALSGAAAKALLLLLRRWNGLERNNNGKLPLSVRDIKTYCHVGSAHACEVTRELATSELAVPMQKGSFAWKARHAATWRITFLPTAAAAADWRFMSQQNLEVGSRCRNRSVPAAGTDGGSAKVKTRESVPAVGTDGAALGSHCRNTSKVQVGCAVSCSFDVLGVHVAVAPRAPVGTFRDKAAWLRSWLANGRITSADVAAVLGIAPENVDAIADGRVTIGNKSWQKLAELVARKLQKRGT